MEELQAGDPPRVGPYLLLARLGAGGMGQVFLGRSPGGRLVAVKVIRADLAGDPGFRARFAREVAAARGVGGVFTAPVMDADPAAPLPWLATGYVSGLSLAAAVVGYGPLPVASVLALAAGLAEGLSAVHAVGVVHRDLKPSNVLLAPDGPRLIDFGISQAVDATHLTQAGTVIGSPGFMSPEQVEGATVGPASDVFSLGSVLVFAATGEGPFGSGAPAALLYRVVHGTPALDRVPVEVRPLVQRCLTRDPAQRPTAQQFLAELTAAYPTAADLTDWLPAPILSAVSSPRTSPGQAAFAQTHTAGLGNQQGPAGPAGQPAVGAVPPTPAPWPSGGQNAAPATGPGFNWASMTTPVAGTPASYVTATGTKPRRRRQLLGVVSGIAAAAVLGAAALLIAAPWKGSPVLQPTGLAADSATTSSVTFRWLGPPTGPAPDNYEIVDDGHVIATVLGDVTSYQVAGLAPDTAYRLQVIAIRGGKQSTESRVLSVATLAPPVSAAVLTGGFTVNYKLIAASPLDNKGILKIGSTWSDTWTFTPDCKAGPCNAMLSGTFDGTGFNASLTRSGGMYTGTSPLIDFEYCVEKTNYVRDTVHFQIQADRAGVQGSTWQVSAWAGTVTLDFPYSSNGNCYADTFKININGSH